MVTSHSRQGTPINGWLTRHPSRFTNHESLQVLLRPPQAGYRVSCGTVLAADPTLIAHFVDVPEQEVIVDLTRARLVPAGRVGKLHVADLRQVLLDRRGEIALVDLHMIDVVL